MLIVLRQEYDVTPLYCVPLQGGCVCVWLERSLDHIKRIVQGLCAAYFS
jgi:hypothetical protein